MHHSNAEKALTILKGFVTGIDEISRMPGLAPTDLILLQGVAGHALLLARRMDAKARGENLTHVFENINKAASQILAEPATTKVQ